ncbi:ribokinase [Xenorhabdus nematophila]|uniref:Ribokinase n=1 Tax=Xenorhabdus nematophila (strain ATCC 19061 / DSM 3370 / CCUG 14189 / LMG 1036 / NCIMB 9965 / AN6) TaxID=406817 RepID=D3VG45_XENNA|nr:ribokinase [Xenorhabdus nematophila]CEE89902.1 ribokinase [Xenorhabdus nematophila str. Anatoliense]CEF28414.1 ribokinase [Xenorhabdus nematophila str. Websteri]AYA41644.1 ribokinase [Xenorhabdus nematophila]KHD29139.1 ribokinase [Xenorhabdus nematophila]MBA0020381.1 ribokinase [Xenorhabdus nematophila]
MSMAKLVVMGSINVDHILNLESFPQPGETVKGRQYQVAFGGKGANQAVAAGRCGADITFIACVGQDGIGEQVRQQLAKDNINTSSIECIEGETTGVALIFVNQQGENVIGINAGANGALTPDYFRCYEQVVKDADALLLQLETPLETVQLAAETSKKHHTKVILNPAPAQKISAQLLSLVDIITPNETEAECLTGITVKDDAGAKEAALALHDQGIETVIITLGSRGVWLSEKGKEGKIVPGFKVKVIDTIAAGDTFNGALVTGLLEGKEMLSAIRFAHAAAAIAVTRQGAQPAVPWRHEIDTFLSEQDSLWLP